MNSDEEKQEKRGFKVEDRRRFSDTGETRPEAPGTPSAPPREESPAVARSTAEDQHDALPLNFSTFVISLSTQALAHLGEIPNPIDRQTTLDLVAAKHMIDILGILQEKTKGNLDAAESALLDGVLYDLRLKYVERVRGRS